MSLFGSYNPITIEIDYLKEALTKARNSGDKATETLILRNLRSFGCFATG